MSEILVKVSQGSNNLKELQTAFKDNSLEGLLSALNEAKETSNSFLTELVNQQKSRENTNIRKVEEIQNSGEEDVGEESEKKKQKR